MGHLSPLLAHPDWEIHKVCPIRSSPRRVKTCTPKIKKGCRVWASFAPPCSSRMGNTQVCPIRSSPRRVKTCTPKIKKGCRWGVFRPFSLIPNGKYIKYVPSGPRLVVSKPALLKSKGLQVGRLSSLLVLPEREVFELCPVRSVPAVEPVSPVYLLRSYFLCLDQDENTSGGQPKKIYGERPFFATQISGQHTQCDPAYADCCQARAHETR